MQQPGCMALAIGIAVLATVHISGDNPPPVVEQRDPDKIINKARARLAALEGKHPLLKGVAKVKLEVERDTKGRLKSARFLFERNSKPVAKAEAEAKDKTKPFLFVSIQIWSGRSQQPPADLHEFQWKGETYQMWVRVFGTDAALIKTVRAAADVYRAEPPEPKLPSR